MTHFETPIAEQDVSNKLTIMESLMTFHFENSKF